MNKREAKTYIVATKNKENFTKLIKGEFFGIFIIKENNIVVDILKGWYHLGNACYGFGVGMLEA